MTRMTGPDCAVMCNLINTHTHTLGRKRGKRRQERIDSVAANSDNHEIDVEIFGLKENKRRQGNMGSVDVDPEERGGKRLIRNYRYMYN